MTLSIITINRNNAAGLKKTIQSVASQTYTDFEYIVIDGASDDGSVEIIKTYMDKITYWVSEPDMGIFNAMNKGIGKARGDYCLFLNSGDWLIDDTTLARVFEEIVCADEAEIYYTDVQVYPPLYDCIYQPQKLDINYLIIYNINHQNALIKRSLFLEHGFYSEKFKISADYEFWLKECYIHKTKFIYITTNISIYDLTGISSTNDSTAEKEDAIRGVFGDLSITLINWRRWYKDSTIYRSIIETYGYSKLLEFMLKSYRYIIKRATKLFKKKGKKTDDASGKETP